jgi:hypothetical protein
MADAAVPGALARQFVTALLDGRFPDAWNLLAPDTQEQFRTLDAFASDRAAFLKSAGDNVIVGEPSNAPALLSKWLPGISADQIDASAAFVVEVEYPALASRNGSPEVLVVAPNPDGAWKIWIVR